MGLMELTKVYEVKPICEDWTCKLRFTSRSWVENRTLYIARKDCIER